MGLIDRIRVGVTRLLLKASTLTFVPRWMQASFMQPTWRALVKEGYKGNSAVMACASALAFAFPEPPLMVYRETEQGLEPQLAHPLRQLFRRPNKSMDEATFKAFCIVYAAIGGNAYIYRERSLSGRTVALWPLSDGQIVPIPGRSSEEGIVGGYEYWIGGEQVGVFDPADIIHWRWMVDPEQPWRGIGAIQAAAREVDQDSEATRYLFQLLVNDAIPRVVVTMAEGDEITDPKAERLQKEWAQRHGGDNRGTAAFIEHGMAVEPLSMDFTQLAFEALRSVPESRISANFRTPPIIAGLAVGLARSTYSNYGEARISWTQDTLVKLWRSFDTLFDMAFMDEYDDKTIVVQHDLSDVAALRELETGIWERNLKGVDAGVVKRGEARKAMGLKTGPEDDVYKESLTFYWSDGSSSQPPQPAQETPTAQQQQGWRDQYTEAKMSDVFGALKTAGPILRIESKARRREMQIALTAALQRVRVSTAGKMSSALDQYFERLAQTVDQRLNRFKSGGKKTEMKRTPTVDDLLTDADAQELVMVERRFVVELLTASWDVWNLALGSSASFELTDSLVTSALAGSGKRIVGIHETTRRAVEDVLKRANELGLSVDQIARGVPDENIPGVRDIVKETYRNRAKTIARNELGTAQNQATAARYTDGGVEKVFILDNGQDGDDEPCKIANGQIWSVRAFNANPLQHPNCTRAAAPELSDAKIDVE